MKDLKNIKLIILDCDGVLTDGKIIYDDKGNETKNFSARDGLGIKLLSFTDIELAVITGRESEILTRRCKDLGIKFLYQKIRNKLRCAEKLIEDLGIKWENVAMLGDDWNDFLLLKKVHFSAVPADAMSGIREAVDHVTERNGGEGAVRELIELILYEKGILDESIQKLLDYLSSH